MVTDAKMQMVFGTQVEAPNSKPSSEEECATNTPRSTFKSSADLTVESHRSDSKPREDYESDSESGDADEEFEHQYYAFLREMAGSAHEASGEDDESDWDSGCEAGEEDEEGPSGKSVSTTGVAESGLSPTLSPIGDPQLVGGRTNMGEANRGSGREADKDPIAGPDNNINRGDGEPPENGKWAVFNEVVGDGKLSMSTKLAECNSFSTRSGGTSEDFLDDPHGGELDAVEPLEDERCFWVPSPCNDNRGPVEDDYDVVKAVADYAAKESGDPTSLKGDRLRADMELKMAQARSLLGPANNPQIPEKTRAHYAKVRMEILGEAEALGREAVALTGRPIASCEGKVGVGVVEVAWSDVDPVGFD